MQALLHVKFYISYKNKNKVHNPYNFNYSAWRHNKLRDSQTENFSLKSAYSILLFHINNTMNGLYSVTYMITMPNPGGPQQQQSINTFHCLNAFNSFSHLQILIPFCSYQKHFQHVHKNISQASQSSKKLGHCSKLNNYIKGKKPACNH